MSAPIIALCWRGGSGRDERDNDLNDADCPRLLFRIKVRVRDKCAGLVNTRAVKEPLRSFTGLGEGPLLNGCSKMISRHEIGFQMQRSLAIG